MQRKHFIGQLVGLTSIGMMLNACKRNSSSWTVTITGANAALGHKLRDQPSIPEPEETEHMEVMIIGAGVSGLSAARNLFQKGIRDIRILELETQIGGNARSAENKVSAYPCGAHYVPIPNNDLHEYLAFLEEAKVITGYDENRNPVFNELFLCFDPEERLFINGTWQEGLVPHFGVPAAEQKQISAFLQQMDHYRYLKGTDGKDAFAIPVDRSSKDQMTTALDQLTMREWLQQQGYTSEYLFNYINYCCRDDYGTDMNNVSAWAGIHYYAARKGKGANASHADVLTWPEGNGFLVAELAKNIGSVIQTSCLVNKVEVKGEKLWIDYYDAMANKQKRCIADYCIMAVPQYITNRLLKDEDRKSKVNALMQYVPWMVANLQLKTMPEHSGVSTSWDNVLYNSSGLGYVDATHQLTQQHHTHKNFTYYLPINHLPPDEARKWARARTKEEWEQFILMDMKKVYPDIEKYLEEIGITIWGHAMAQPLPGMIFGENRQLLKQTLQERIYFAHTDLAGISIFEEAFYQGYTTAELIAKKAGK